MRIRDIFLSTALCLVIVFSVLQNALIIASLSVILFSIKYRSYVLIPIAILLDGYFGSFYHIPVLSILVIVWSVLFELIRPRLFVVQS